MDIKSNKLFETFHALLITKGMFRFAYHLILNSMAFKFFNSIANFKFSIFILPLFITNHLVVTADNCGCRMFK